MMTLFTMPRRLVRIPFYFLYFLSIFSIDERALVTAARNYGWRFVTRTPNYVDVDVLGQTQRYEILNVLEFTSKRKRMSVITRDPKGVIKILTKGADSVIYERLSPGNLLYRDTTLKQLEEFATEGLRTLCCASAVIPSETYEVWGIFNCVIIGLILFCLGVASDIS